MQKSTQFTGQKAMFLNMQEDGLKQRASTFKNKKAYNRTKKYRNSEV